MKNRHTKTKIIVATLTTILIITTILTSSTLTKAKGFEYSIIIDKINGHRIDELPEFLLSPIHLEGKASGIDFVGQLYQYQVQVDWGDGTIDENSTINFEIRDLNNNNKDDFSGNWSSDLDHNYAAYGTYTITVKLYHEKPPGIESAIAQFAINITVVTSIAVTTQPEGLNIVVDGASYTAPRGFNWAAGETHSIGTTSPQPDGLGVQYVWQSWNDGGAANHTISVPPTPTIYTAYFKTQYYLNVSDNIDGQTGLSSLSGWRDKDTYVNLTARDVKGYSFSEWIVDGVSKGNNVETIVYMDKPHTAIARYQPIIAQQFQITITASPDGAKGGTFNVTYVKDGSTYTEEKSTPWTGWVDAYTNVTISNPQIYVPSEAGVDGVRYMFCSYTPSEPISVDGNKTITLVYKTQYKLTMSVSPSGGGTTNPPEGTYWHDNNTLVTISATANNGYRFDSWTGFGLSSYSGTNSSAGIIMNGPINETANFVALATVMFSAIGFSSDASGPVLTVDSNNYSYFDLPADFTWDVGSSHSFSWSYSVSSTTPGKLYIWNSTVGLSTLKNGSINVPSDGGWINATYKTQYLLTIGVSPPGAGTTNPPPGNYWHYNGSSVPVFANVSTGYTFSHWLLDGNNVGSNNEINVAMNAPHNLTAVFTGPISQLTVNVYKNGTSTGISGATVKIDEANYTTDSDGRVQVQVSHGYHTVEIVTPYSPSDGTRYVFTSWSNGSTSNRLDITVTSNLTLTAYMKIQHYLTVNSAHGTTGGEGWYDAGATAYASVTQLTVEGPAGTRYVFTNWSGDASGTTSRSNPITMNSPKTAVANWKTQYLLTVVTDPSHLSQQPTRNPEGEAGPDSSWWYDAATNVLLTAQPVSGYTFSYWHVDDLSRESGVNPITVPMNAPHTATAHYSTITPPSPITATVTFCQEGIGEDSNETVLTVDGAGYTVGQLPITFTWNVSSSHSFAWSDYVNASSGKRYLWASTSGLSTDKAGLITVSSEGGSVTATYKTQYYLTLATNPIGVTSPSGEGWYDAYSEASISTCEFVNLTQDSRYRFEVWTAADVTEITDPSAPSTTVLMDKAKTATANYVLQYYLTVNSDYGCPNPTSGWFDNGTEITASVTSPYPSEPIDIRHSCTGWTGTGSVTHSGTTASVTFTINAPSSITWNWKTQYLLIVVTDPLRLTPQPSRSPTGEADLVNGWWYDYGTKVTLAANPVSGYTFNYWDIDNTPRETGENPINVTMNATHIATAHYSTITPPPPPPPPPPPITATVTFCQDGIGEDSNETVLTVDGIGYTVGQLPLTFTWDVGSPHSFTWADPVVTPTDGKRYVWNSTRGLSTVQSGTLIVPFGGGFVNATYKVQYYLEVSSEYGETSTPSGWYDAGTNIVVTVTSPVQGPIDTRYVCIGWNGTGSVPSMGNGKTVTFNLKEPSSITWNWKVQYFLRMDVKPEGSGIATPSSGWYDAGLTVQILAAPYSGYRFERWTGSGLGSYNGTDSQAKVTMNNPINETANFVAVATITFSVKGLASDASGTLLTVDGASYSCDQLPKSFIWDYGSVHSYTWTGTVNADVAGKRYNWASTSGASTLQSGSLTVSGSGEVTGNYRSMYLLEVLSQYGNPRGGGWYIEGQEARFGVSTPVDHGNRTIRVFVKWTGDLELYTPEGSIIMNKPCRVAASWETQYLITFNTTLPNGVVLSIPNVPTTLPLGMEVYGAYYPAYETLTVGPAPGTAPGSEGTRYAFKGWNMDGERLTGEAVLKFTVDGPHDVSVVYGVEHLLTVKALGVENPFKARLTVQTSPPVDYELKPTNPVSLWLAEGVHVTLTVSTPNKIGHGEWAIFKEWTGKAQGTKTTTSLTLLSPTTVNAVFFKVNPVAISIPYSIIAGLIALALCTLIVRRRRTEDHRKRRSAISGITVLAVVLIVAAMVSAIIALGYGINIYELPDITNWAVVFTIIEAMIFLLVSTAIAWKVQRKPEEPKTTIETAQ